MFYPRSFSLQNSAAQVLMVVSHAILSSCSELGSSFGTQCRDSRSLELEPDSRELRGDLKQLFHIGSNFLYVKKEELVSRQNERILLLSNSTKIIVIYWIIVSRNLPKQEWSHTIFQSCFINLCSVQNGTSSPQPTVQIKHYLFHFENNGKELYGVLKKGLCPVPEAANDEITFKADESLMVILAVELFSLSSASKNC